MFSGFTNRITLKISKYTPYCYIEIWQMFCGENNFLAIIRLYPFYNMNVMLNFVLKCDFFEKARLTWVDI